MISYRKNYAFLCLFFNRDSLHDILLVIIEYSTRDYRVQ